MKRQNKTGWFRKSDI